MDLWDEHLFEEDLSGKINSMIDSNSLILFFKKGEDLFGADEDGRVVFAKMKNPDEDMPDGWEDEASFSAQNLHKVMRGEPAQHLFRHEDLKAIKIIDREKMVDLLKAEADKLGDEAFPARKMTVISLSKLFQRDPDDAPNFVRADEE